VWVRRAQRGEGMDGWMDRHVDVEEEDNDGNVEMRGAPRAVSQRRSRR